MIDISVFGPTVIAGEGCRLTASDLGGAKPRQVLEMLALDLGTPLAKDLIAERLWDGRPPKSYIATLESYVCALRRRLGLLGGRHGPLATSNHGYLLDPAQVRVDAVSVRGLLSGDEIDVARALDLAVGRLLVDEPYAGWATEARESLDEALALACSAAAAAANARGEYAIALRFAREATSRSYFSEPATKELMRALDGVGARANALQTYDSFRAGMLEELGLEPSPETQALYLAILRRGHTPGPGDSDQDEVRTLLQLLRRALEADPGILSGFPAMHEVGRLLLAGSV